MGNCCAGPLGRYFGDVMLYPLRQVPFPKLPPEYGISDYHEVRFPAADGVQLVGWLLNEQAPGKKGVIIMTHFGYRADRWGYQYRKQPWATRPYGKDVEFLAVAKRLCEADYAVLMYDLRNHGESGASPLGVGTGGVEERLDVLGAVKFASTLGLPLGLLSYCMGSNATFCAMQEDPGAFRQCKVKALVSMQPHTNGKFLHAYGINGALYEEADKHFKEKTNGVALDHPVQEAAKSIMVPTLMLQGERDQWQNRPFVEECYANIPVAEKEMVWLKETVHRFDGYNYFADHPERMLTWFDRYIGA